MTAPTASQAQLMKLIMTMARSHTPVMTVSTDSSSRVGSVLEELCMQGSAVPLMALNWTGVSQR